MGCWAMVGDYNDDSSIRENLNLLLRLTWVEASVDSKRSRLKVLEGLLQESKILGASTVTPGIGWLHREF